VVDSTEDQPKVIRIVDHGTYRWNVRQNKYAHNAQLENSPAKK